MFFASSTKHLAGAYELLVAMASLARLKTCCITGLEAQSVDVEVFSRLGQRKFTVIGLGDSAVRESRDRVTQALKHLGLFVPNVVLVNLAPAEIKKEGSSFDLAIAIGVLVSTRQISIPDIDETFFFGELSLSGSINPLRGALAFVISAFQSGAKKVVVPAANFAEASLIKGIEIIPVTSLDELIEYYKSGELPEHDQPEGSTLSAPAERISDVYGQAQAKRALIIAASGGHNTLFIGPPGCGKSMLAGRFPTILPPLTEEECLEVVKIHSVAGLPIEPYLSGSRPFRNPHHIVSEAGLIGGGSIPKPGEISLAHNGVLFLDEFPEFRRGALESLRAPLESGSVQITRAKASHTFPANFQLIAAMNPCPCGRLGVASATCLCSRHEIQSYLRKLSEPILDRIDLHVELNAVQFTEMKFEDREPSDDFLALVLAARDRQLALRGKLNAQIEIGEINKSVIIKDEALRLIDKVSKQISLSARSIVRSLRVALTIADLEFSEVIEPKHVAEALSFRKLEKLKHYASN